MKLTTNLAAFLKKCLCLLFFNDISLPCIQAEIIIVLQSLGWGLYQIHSAVYFKPISTSPLACHSKISFLNLR